MGLFDRFRSRATITDPAALVAAGAQLRVGEAPPQGALSRANTDDPLWGFYRAVGELHYSVTFAGNAMRRVRLVPALLGPDDEPGQLFDEDGKVVDGVDQTLALTARALVRGLRARTGGQSRLLARLGKILAVTGDCYLLGTDDLGPGGGVLGRSFEALSRSELRAKAGGGWQRKRGPGARPEDISEDAYILRIWDDDPQWSLLGDSTPAAISDVLEENVLLTRQVRAEALSRLMRGVWLLPDSMHMAGEEKAPAGVDPVAWVLIQAATMAIQDKGSASAMIPLIARAKKEDIEASKLVDFSNQDNAASILKRRETVERIAQGSDFPPEIITGHKATTFSNAFAIDESTFRLHLAPKLDLICDPLTGNYLWSGLMLAMGMNPLKVPVPEEVRRIVVHYDASDLVVHPNREQAVEHAYGTATQPNFAISGSAYRRNKGFPEGDKPDEEEIAERLAWAKMLKGGGSQPPGEDEPENVDGIPREDAAPNGSAPVSANGQMARHAAESLMLQLQAAGEMAIERAVVKIGNQLKNKDARFAKTNPRDVARFVGPDQLTRRLGPDPLAGEFTVTRELAVRWARDAAYPHPEELGERMEAMLRRHCTARLFQEGGQLELSEVMDVLAARSET